MRLRSSLFLLLVLGLAFGLTGCGGPSLPKTISVSGKVTYKGQPLKGAAVLFIAKKGPPAQAVTDASGAFKLGTYKSGDGAVPGEYGVAISAVVDPNPGATYIDASTAKLKWLIPAKYGSAETSKLTATVAKGQQEFTFNLD